ncbi:MAG: hypothetical protein ACRCU5_05710 [Rhizobiaceae bacterium]
MKKTFAIAALLLTSGSALAQDAERFSLQKTADGYVRLNVETGEMSICKEQGAQLVCRMAADERKALEGGMAGLEERLSTIEERLTAIEKAGTSATQSLPTEEEFEKTVGYMEKFFRRFMGVVKDLNETEPQPNKT